MVEKQRQIQLPDAIVTRGKCFRSIVVGATLILLSLISALNDPVLALTKFCVKISQSSYLTYKMQQTLDSASIKIYIFNITNSEEFLSGKDLNLKLQEVGPFTYHEDRSNEDIEVDSEKKVLRYTPIEKLRFIPEESVSDPADTILYLPNSIFLALASRLSREPYFIKSTFNLLTRQLHTKSILKISAKDLLWGYDDILVTIGKKIVPGIVVFEKFGLLSYAFGPNNRVRYEVNATAENKFEIITVNRSQGIINLGYESKKQNCNTFKNGFEGMLFPTMLSSNRSIKLFHKVFCRFYDLEYVRNLTMDAGHEVMEYRVSKDAYEHTEQNACYCALLKCYRGLSDVSPCLSGIPVALSHGHFLDAEEAVFHKLEGIKPDAEKHGSQFFIHKVLGMPLQAHMSLQLNIVMEDVSFNSATKPFSNMVVPITWVRADQRPLPTELRILLEAVTIWFPKILVLAEIVMCGCGLYILIKTCRLMFLSRNATKIGYYNQKWNENITTYTESRPMINYTESKC